MIVLIENENSSQYEIRIALVDLFIKRKYKSFARAAVDIGIDKSILRRFLAHEEDIEFMDCVTLMMFIKSNENYFKRFPKRDIWSNRPSILRENLHLYTL